MPNRSALIRRSVCLVSGALCASALAAPEPASTSDSFVDSIGINIHSAQYNGSAWTVYPDNWQAVINAIKDIGIREVRDLPFDTAHLNELTAQAGTKIDAIVEYRDQSLPYDQLDFSKFDYALSSAKALTGLTWLENPNEYDGSADPDYLAHLRSWMTQLATQARMDPVLATKPVIAPTLADLTLIHDLAGYVDRVNLHSYSQPNVPTYQITHDVQSYPQRLDASLPVMVTETGYITGPSGGTSHRISEAAAAKYTPRIYLEHHNLGIEETFDYELLDQYYDPTFISDENHFGLLRYDLTYKPAATALKNLIGLLADPGPKFTASTLDYTITGGDATLHHSLFQKRDGSFYLAIWQDALTFDSVNNVDVVNPTMPVTLNLGSTFPQADIYLPDGSTAPLSTLHSVSQLNLNVPDEVMLIHLGLGAPGMLFASGVRTISADSELGSVPTTPTTNLTFIGGTMRAGADLAIASNRLITLGAGGGTIDTNSFNVTYNGALSGTGALTKAGAGTLHVKNLNYTGPLTIAGGTLHVLPSGRDAASTSVLSAVPVIAPGAQLDLEDNALVINYGSETTGATRAAIRNLLINGRGAGPGSAAPWNGTGGIASSFAHANGNGSNLAIGYADNATLASINTAGSYTSFGGQTVSSSSILVQLTLGADANLDGTVDGQDVSIVGTHFNKPGSGQWYLGDFDYSGMCDGADVPVLGTTFGKTSPTLSPAQLSAEFGSAFSAAFEAGRGSGSASNVPEPASLVLIMAGAPALLARRRRHRSSRPAI